MRHVSATSSFTCVFVDELSPETLGSRRTCQDLPEVPQVPQAAVDGVKPALNELTRLREEKGLSLQELARTVGISPHYLGMIESAERQPDAAIKRALAWTLGVAGWEEKL